MGRNHTIEDELGEVDVIFFEVTSVEDLHQFQQLRRRSKVPVLLYGSGVPSSTWIQGLRAGADAFLDLPDREDVVRARLIGFLRRAGLKPYGARV
ncbi:MAG: hypothetical protein D6791_15110 [Chloroflexi bacterium]|nr:MAG: hypothetical protein D6791_15110 [Chloroflexota bacterium]